MPPPLPRHVRHSHSDVCDACDDRVTSREASCFLVYFAAQRSLGLTKRRTPINHQQPTHHSSRLISPKPACTSPCSTTSPLHCELLVQRPAYSTHPQKPEHHVHSSQSSASFRGQPAPLDQIPAPAKVSYRCSPPSGDRWRLFLRNRKFEQHPCRHRPKHFRRKLRLLATIRACEIACEIWQRRLIRVRDQLNIVSCDCLENTTQTTILRILPLR